MKKLTYIFILATAQFLFAQNKVTDGIGINKDKDLRAEVDVNGNVSLETADKSTNENLRPLYISTDENSRRLAVYPQGRKPFTILNYKLEPKEGSDWLKDVNLRIKSKDYFLIVSNAYLENYKWEAYLSQFPNPVVWGTSHAFRNGDPGGKVYNALQKVEVQDHAYEGDDKKYWHLTADIFGSEPYCYNSVWGEPSECKWYYWDITILAFDRSLVKTLETYHAKDTAGDSTNILESLKNSAK